MTVNEGCSGMKQSVKVKALVKLGGLVNKIARRIKMRPNAPSAELHHPSFGRPETFSHYTRIMSSRDTVKSLSQFRASICLI